MYSAKQSKDCFRFSFQRSTRRPTRGWKHDRAP
jgi:hypothetical protein